MKKIISLVLSLLLLFAVPVPPAAAAGLPFTDVPADSWFAPYVTDCYDQGIFKGTSDTRFSPHLNISRAMFVQTLANKSVTYQKTEGPQIYRDVKPGDWYYDAVQWATGVNLVSGSNGLFRPNDPITRADICVILRNYNFAAVTNRFPSDTSTGWDRFTDLEDAPGYAADAIVWAGNRGIVAGKDHRRFSPLDQMTRAEAAVVLSKTSKTKDPSYETAPMTFRLKGQDAITMDFPLSWQENALIQRDDDWQGDGYALAIFRDKSNVIYPTEPGSPEIDGGRLFSLCATSKPEEIQHINLHQILGTNVIDGVNYTFYIFRSSDVQVWNNDGEQYMKMSWEMEIAFRTASFP